MVRANHTSAHLVDGFDRLVRILFLKNGHSHHRRLAGVDENLNDHYSARLVAQMRERVYIPSMRDVAAFRCCQNSPTGYLEGRSYFPSA